MPDTTQPTVVAPRANQTAGTAIGAQAVNAAVDYMSWAVAQMFGQAMTELVENINSVKDRDRLASDLTGIVYDTLRLKWFQLCGAGTELDYYGELCTGCDCPKHRCDSYGHGRKCCPDCRHTRTAIPVGLVDAR